MVLLFQRMSLYLQNPLFMMRTFLFLFVLTCFKSHAQSTYAVISQPEYNVLFDGYPNIIRVGWWKKPQVVEFVGEGMQVKKTGQQGTFECTPRGVKLSKIHAVNTKTKDTVASYTFRVIPLPKPAVYLGEAREGEKVKNRSLLALAVKLDDDAPISSTYEITEWEITFPNDNKLYTGTGNQLTAEVVEKIRASSDGSVLNVAVLYSGTGVPRKFTRVKFTL